MAIVAVTPVQAQTAPPLEAIRSGRYDEAIAFLEPRVRARRASADELRWFADALLAVGRYDDAIEALGSAPAEFEVEVSNRLGEALRARGRLAEARARFERAMTGDADDRVAAELSLAILDFDGGDRESAARRFERFIALYNAAGDLDAEALTAVGVASAYLGRDDPQLFHDAVRALDEAIAADPGDPRPRLILGELFLAKYDSGEAAGLLQDVLEANPRNPAALVAEARRLHFDGDATAIDRVREALAINPNLVTGRAFMARLLLIAEQREAAVAEAEQALRVDPGALEALSVLAAARYLQGDLAEFDRIAARARVVNPADGELYHVTAELAVQNRFYSEAVDLAATAVELDPHNWPARGTLGINQLRIGEIEAGRSQLEQAFAGDPFNVWIKNTLDLLDTYHRYRTVATRHFDLFIEDELADALALYMAPLADEALETLTTRYGTGPDQRVRVEVYRRHADFSVRTVGLAGLGALGVAFGSVVAVDAPMAPGMGPFNWGTTLWHEIAHVITLGATGNRIPRWLTEGLSVYEERRARPGWGEEITPDFVAAWIDGRLHPVSRINDGFVRPEYPQHVAHSYLQASLVCELIDEAHGFEAIRQMLEGYRAGATTDDLVGEILGLTATEFDAEFTDWFERRYAGQIAAMRPSRQRSRARQPAERGAATGPRDQVATEAIEALVQGDPDDFVARLQLGARYYELGRDTEAIPHLRRARELFPEHVGGSSAYGYLARLYEQNGDIAAAIDELRAFVARDEGALDANLKLAELLERTGDTGAAAEALTRAIYVNPFDAGLHQRLARIHGELGDWPAAVIERRAVVAMNPVDRAEALFALAITQRNASDLAGARRSVLGALEIAPGYREAQELLLEIRRAGKETS